MNWDSERLGRKKKERMKKERERERERERGREREKLKVWSAFVFIPVKKVFENDLKIGSFLKCKF